MTMPTVRFTAEAPDGAVLTRSSKTMNYTYYVAVHGAPEDNAPGWGAWGWSQSPTGAAKMAREAAKVYAAVQVLPAGT